MENHIRAMVEKAKRENASDIFLVVGRPISFRKGDSIESIDNNRLMPEHTAAMIKAIYAMANPPRDMHILDRGDDDFSFSIAGVARCRVSAYKQRGSLSAVMRVISFEMPKPKDLHIPDEIIELGSQKNGMVLVTGPAGSGKSTTLACMIDHINQNENKHIITLEDPIEYMHRHNKSIVSQREVKIDTESYKTALSAALRQSPDVILLGEMRDYDTISVAMTAAETGHLLLSTLHTTGAANTINRIIDVFPANQQHQIAIQLSTVLRAVISQMRVPGFDEATGNAITVPVFEIMTVTPAIRNMIRDNKIYQIDGEVYSKSGTEGMQAMDKHLLQLVEDRIIDPKTARKYASKKERIEKELGPDTTPGMYK